MTSCVQFIESLAMAVHWIFVNIPAEVLRLGGGLKL